MQKLLTVQEKNLQCDTWTIKHLQNDNIWLTDNYLKYAY